MKGRKSVRKSYKNVLVHLGKTGGELAEALNIILLANKDIGITESSFFRGLFVSFLEKEGVLSKKKSNL